MRMLPFGRVVPYLAAFGRLAKFTQPRQGVASLPLVDSRPGQARSLEEETEISR